MSKRRYTIETITSGQARPYADTVRRSRITYEWQGLLGYKDKDAPFVPWDANSDTARRDAKHNSGWIEEGEGDPFSTRLVYLKMIEPGIWEWETSARYND